jgi:hypothetical protein
MWEALQAWLLTTVHKEGLTGAQEGSFSHCGRVWSSALWGMLWGTPLGHSHSSWHGCGLP